MSLHGEIKVNGFAIGSWEARRSYEITMVKDYGPRYMYNCIWFRNGGSYTFTVEHYYNDGAEVLAAKVMSYVAEHHPNKREVEPRNG